MSTLLYAKLTTRRDEALAGTSTSTAPPGVGTYVDALAALVPAEVLTVHAVILPFTTDSKGGTTHITDAPTLVWSFYALIVLSIVIYVLGRDRRIDRLDWVRIAIPPTAFVAWTMLQRATAFDAIAPDLRSGPRTAIAIFIAVFLGIVATALSNRADQSQPGTDSLGKKIGEEHP